MFIGALFTIAKACKQAKYPSTEEWIKKMWGVCVCVCMCVYRYRYRYRYRCNGIILSHKNEGNNVNFRNMDGSRDYHTK